MSADSISNPDPTFFGTTKPSPTPLPQSQSKTWKSTDARERDQFSRVKNLLYHFVPDSPFPPQTLAEWMTHRAAMHDEGKETLLKSIALKQALKSANSRIPFKSAFGSHGKHCLVDNRSTVLSLPSIWSPTYTPPLGRPDAEWPERAEMQHEGEDRASGDGGKINFGRFLPLPRQPVNETVKWELKAVMEPLSMIDVTGIRPNTIDEGGNIVDLPEVWNQNMTMDFDDEFWEQGEKYLGKELTDEL
jgi:hypothetical protein